jgi:endoglucanase
VDNSSIKNENGNDVIFKGISSHGIQWYSDLLTSDALKYLKSEFKINVFRLPVYVNEEYDYENLIGTLEPIINELIDLNLYIIIDWHVLEDGDPNNNIANASDFFSKLSNKYSDTPNIIYEICNEPNGNNVTWNEQIKPYAEEIIPIIRKNSGKSLIIVGTPDWCKDLNSPANNPLKFKNVMYSCHFYAGTHGTELQDCIDNALAKGLPIFVSEWGTTDAYGDGQIYLEKSKQWIDFLNERNISWINWSFANKYESSSIISYLYQDFSENFNDYLSPSGSFVKSLFK